MLQIETAVDNSFLDDNDDPGGGGNKYLRI